MRGVVMVRPAGVSDVTALAKFTEDSAGSVLRGRLESPADRERRFEELLRDPRRVVLVAPSAAGDLDGVLIATEEEVGALHPVTTLAVSTLLVAADRRRRGVGRTLLVEAVRTAEARGLDSVVASVSSIDRDANRYLARLGFGPMVVRRIAATSTLRRTLAMTDPVTRTVPRRRPRVRLPLRGLTRG